MNIWLYWDNVATKTTPNYIRLCFKSLMKCCKNKHSIFFLNKNNIQFYLENIPTELSKVKRDMPGHSILRFVNGINYKKAMSNSIAIQLAYIRLRLLYSYGGLWLDSDCITMSDYDEIENALQQYEIVGLRKESHGDNHIANNFIAFQKKSQKLREIIDQQEYIIKRNRYIRWGEIGGSLLKKNLVHYDKIFLIDEKKVLPIPWQEANKFFQNEPIELMSMVAIKCAKNGRLKMGHQGDGLGGSIKNPPSSSSRVSSR